MASRIHMGGDPEDVEIMDDGHPNEPTIRLKQGDAVIELSPEGARSLAFTLMGMTSPRDAVDNS